MCRIVTRRSLKVYLWLAVSVVGLTSGLFSQAPAERMVFAETDRLHLAPPISSNRPATGSKLAARQINASEYSGEYALRELAPAIGGSITVGDFDGDGYPDLYVVVPGGQNSLFRNTGDGSFRDVTAKAGVSGTKGSLYLSAAFNDYDHSGHASLFVAGAGGVVLYHNDGNGTFSDATQKAGLQSKAGELCTRAVLADVDGDGFPDLLVTVYTDLNQPPPKATFTFPNDFPGAASRLYRNNGNGTFTDVTAIAGLAGNPGRTRNAVFADFNNDRRPDLLLLRDDKPPVLYLNRGGGKFQDATWDAGEELTRHAFFDAAVADFNLDGKPDLALWSTMSFHVMLNRGNAVFKQAESMPPLTPPPSLFGFHGMVGDLAGKGFDDVMTLDNDGRWRPFLNQAGHFLEASVLLTGTGRALDPVSSVTPLRLAGPVGLYLLALHPDGRIAVLERLANSGSIAKKPRWR